MRKCVTHIMYVDWVTRYGHEGNIYKPLPDENIAKLPHILMSDYGQTTFTDNLHLLTDNTDKIMFTGCIKKKITFKIRKGH